MSISLREVSRPDILAAILIIVTSVAIDLVTKSVAQEHLMTWTHDTDPNHYEGKRVVLSHMGADSSVGPDGRSFITFSLNYVRNLGAAWGMLSNLPDEVRTPFFAVVTLLAIGFVGFSFFSTTSSQHITRYGFALILSGALGNFINRIQFGFVIDWIDVRWNVLGWRYAFPNFNWADCAITIGIAVILIESLRERLAGDESSESAEKIGSKNVVS
ncbi:MAG: signal peptidase II [Oligoflexus sp.]